MKKAKICRVLLAAACTLLTVALCACGGAPSATQSQAQSQSPAQSQAPTPSSAQGGGSKEAPAPTPPAPQTETYEVFNATYATVMELYISSADDTSWGDNLAATGGLAHEDSLYFDTGAGQVDVRYLCDDGLWHEVHDVYLQPGVLISLTLGQTAYGVHIDYHDGTGDYYEELGGGQVNTSITVGLLNDIGYDDDTIVAVYASFPNGDTPGELDLLGEWTLENGGYASAYLDTPGFYTLQVPDSAGATWYFEDVFLDDGSEIRFYRGSQFELYISVIYADGSWSDYYTTGMSA